MKARIVLDASAAIHIVRSLPTALQLLDLLSGTALVTAPGIYRSEVGNTLWKYVRHEGLSRDAAALQLSEAQSLIDSFVDDADLVEEALVAACQFEHPVYDMLYLVLARRRGASLMTMDRRLARLASTMDLEVLTVDLKVPTEN